MVPEDHFDPEVLNFQTFQADQLAHVFQPSQEPPVHLQDGDSRNLVSLHFANLHTFHTVRLGLVWPVRPSHMNAQRHGKGGTPLGIYVRRSSRPDWARAYIKTISSIC